MGTQIGKSSFTPLQESLLILSSIKNQLKTALRTLEPQANIENDDLKFTVCNHLIILVCSFLAEWEILAGRGNDEKGRNTLRSASPALKRIRIWSGLPKLRSKILAHGFREKNGQLVWPWEVFGSYEAPTAYAETIVLANCCVKAIDIAVTRHFGEYVQAAEAMNMVDKKIEEKGIRTIGEIKSALADVDAKLARSAEGIGSETV